MKAIVRQLAASNVRINVLGHSIGARVSRLSPSRKPTRNRCWVSEWTFQLSLVAEDKAAESVGA